MPNDARGIQMKNFIQKQLESYQFKTAQEELNALTEITQEIILYGLAQSNFFQKALFHGGTCLRIIHGMERFSEDLDFSLKAPEPDFDLMFYLEKTIDTIRAYGYEWEIVGSQSVDRNVKSRFLKDGSLKKLISFKHDLGLRKKIKLKIEIDINPPANAKYAAGYVDFPVDFVLSTHDLPTLFAGKCHALLCRPYTKGRDWYDYLWYLKKGIVLNVDFLESSLKQWGPWKGKNIRVTENWINENIGKKIQSMDWKHAVQDVSRFLHSHEKEGLKIWCKDFFLNKTGKLLLPQ